jgi:hypothetical protein
MLEQLYERRIQEQPEQVENSVELSTRNSKRRKIDIHSSHDVDDEDIVYYANVGKKKKGGIGYAGEASEDVSVFDWYIPTAFTCFSEHRPTEGLSCSKGQR